MLFFEAPAVLLSRIFLFSFTGADAQSTDLTFICRWVLRGGSIQPSNEDVCLSIKCRKRTLSHL